jgi:PKD repeat protein
LGVREHNVLSGNSANGVEVSHGTDVRRNQIIGNYIGTDLTGSTSASYTVNSNWGIGIEDGVNDTIISNNVIGNGNRGGIAINGYTQGTTRGTIVRDNLIGISRTGAAIPNNSYGIGVSLDANTTQIGPGNVIANNPYGIILFDQRNVATTITTNSIYGNSNLEIDLRPGVGVTPNDFGDTDNGANGYLNFPAIGLASESRVDGSACGGCVVEVFKADGGEGEYGEGRTYVGTAAADSSGQFSVSVSGLSVGDYVTATATDSGGNTSEFSLNARVLASPAATGVVIASDSYGRTLTDRWGAANTGGFWALSGAATDFDVLNGEGTIRVGIAGQTRAASLLSVHARDVAISARYRTDKLAVGGNQHAWLVARQTQLGTEYRVRIRKGTDGLIYLNAARVTNFAETYFGGDQVVPGVSDAAGSYLNLRAEIAGNSPVSIRVKAWASGAVEPTAWTYSATDASELLSRPGAVGVRVYLQGGAANAPVTYGFDDFAISSVAPPPSAPNAAFSWAQGDDSLDVQFSDGSTGPVDSWAWDFGDGAVSSDQNPVHSFSSGGTYSVTLTVSGPGGTDTESQQVVVVEPPESPVADFSFEQVPGSLGVSFTDDSANDVDSWSWDFGDGGTSTVQNPMHSYAAAASYDVTLTVTGPGGSDSTTRSVVVETPAIQTTVAADAFDREVTGGWGSADLGGTWLRSGPAADFVVTGGVGTLILPTPGSTRAQYLTSVSVSDVDFLFSVASNKAAAGSPQYVYGVARRVSAGTEYAAKVRFAPDGRAYLNVSRFVGGTETVLSNAVQVPGVIHSAGAAVWVRMQLSGVSPTSVQVKAWADGSSEPSSWLVSITDSTSSLQAPGGMGLRAYLGGQTSNAPVQLGFDDFAVKSLP